MKMNTNMKVVLAWAMLLISAGFIGCHTQVKQSERNSGNDGFVAIGVVGGTDTDAKAHIAAILRKNGIECISDGPIGSRVLVPKEMADKAMQVLNKDAQGKCDCNTPGCHTTCTCDCECGDP